jgi:Tol biopolymer transport system component
MKMISNIAICLLLLLTGCSKVQDNVVGVDSDRPGGERVIYKDAETGRTIWRMTVSERNDKHNYYSDQSWSPDMSMIVWSTADYQANRGSIWIMDADGYNFRKLVDDAPYGMHTGCRPTWSPDGLSIYYNTDKAVDLMGNPMTRPADAEEVFTSATHKGRDFVQEYRKGPVYITRQMCYELSPHKAILDDRPAKMMNAKWAPDKSVMMIGYSNENWDPELDRWAKSTEKPSKATVKELFLIDADGTNFRRWVDYGHHHSWTSDSKHIIFNAQDFQGGGLVLQHVDGRPLQKIADEGGVHPSINPQGTLVVTDCYSGEYKDYLVLIHVADGRIEKLVRTPPTHPRAHNHTHCNPSWSPDGSMVIYDNDETGTSQVYVVVVDEDKVRARFGDDAIAK